jgi:hypothetical protein
MLLLAQYVLSAAAPDAVIGWPFSVSVVLWLLLAALVGTLLALLHERASTEPAPKAPAQPGNRYTVRHAH